MELEINEKPEEQQQQQQQQQPQVRLVDIVVTDANVAFNLMISFLNLAQRRGAFSFDESAKILECIKCFRQPDA
jgi:hypothetical protein